QASDRIASTGKCLGTERAGINQEATFELLGLSTRTISSEGRGLFSMQRQMERPILLFLSHVQNEKVEDMSEEKKAVSEVVDQDPDFELWIFENSSASAEPPRERALR